MRKNLFFAKAALMLLLAMLFSLTEARADQLEQLTVYSNGTNTSQYVPVMCGYLQYATRSQFIIPRAQLTDMNGRTVTGVKFYANRNAAFRLPNYNVYVKELANNTSTFDRNGTFQTGGTTVYEGRFAIAKTGELTIVFDTPFNYGGGNLLIGFENTSGESTTEAISFFGSNVNNAACYGNGGDQTTGTRASFVPKTTFTYIMPETYPIPTNIKSTKVGPFEATIKWEGSANSYNLKYRKEGTTTATTYNFDDGLGQWTTIDADGDGFNWALNSIDQTYRSYKADENLEYGLGHNGSADMIISGSFCSNSNNSIYSGTPLSPDNYLVSPQITLGGTISFWAKGMDPADCAEVFGVAVSTNGNTNVANFTMVGETKTATAEWTLYSFDLSAYSGQGYVAIRHFNCMDQDLLCVDDIEIVTPDGAGEWTAVNGISATSKTLEGLTKVTGYQRMGRNPLHHDKREPCTCRN